jgi:cytochrome c553
MPERKLMLVLLVCILALAFAASAHTQPPGAQGGPPMPPARKIPAINAEDKFANACVDCHLNYKEAKMDVRFAPMMKQWNDKVDEKLLAKAQEAAPAGLKLKGKHPPVNDSFQDIPASCLRCHGKASMIAPPFARMMHKIHLTGGEENRFMTMFQGECTHCHKLDMKTGAWAIPSGAEK